MKPGNKSKERLQQLCQLFEMTLRGVTWKYLIKICENRPMRSFCIMIRNEGNFSEHRVVRSFEYNACRELCNVNVASNFVAVFVAPNFHTRDRDYPRRVIKHGLNNGSLLRGKRGSFLQLFSKLLQYFNAEKEIVSSASTFFSSRGTRSLTRRVVIFAVISHAISERRCAGF